VWWRGIQRPSVIECFVPCREEESAILQRYRRSSGNPASGPIFMNGAGKGLDLDSLYRRQMQEPLKLAKIEWEGWHGFRPGLATNLERIGVKESIAAMILRHANDRVTRKHYIKPPTLEAIAAMRRLSESFRRSKSRDWSPTAPQKLRAQPGRPHRLNGYSKAGGR
jgi:integrase